MRIVLLDSLSSNIFSADSFNGKQLYKSLVKESKKFEKAYKILHPTINIYNIQEYNKQYEKIRLEYYKKLLYSSQKSTYKLMKKNEK